jgi:CheY-like chemotaxis protein
MVRRLTVEALDEAGYRVLEAGDGSAGLRLLDKDPQIALLFTDVVLADPLDGRKLAGEALQRRPSLKLVSTTGYTRNAIIHHGRLDEGVNFRPSPSPPPICCKRSGTSLAKRVRPKPEMLPLSWPAVRLRG